MLGRDVDDVEGFFDGFVAVMFISFRGAKIVAEVDCAELSE
jgi:hypothetical protein